MNILGFEIERRRAERPEVWEQLGTVPGAGTSTVPHSYAVGQEVATVVNGFRAAGTHTAVFDAASLSSGIYFYALKAGGFTSVKKMTVMR